MPQINHFNPASMAPKMMKAAVCKEVCPKRNSSFTPSQPSPYLSHTVIPTNRPLLLTGTQTTHNRGPPHPNTNRPQPPRPRPSRLSLPLRRLPLARPTRPPVNQPDPRPRSSLNRRRTRPQRGRLRDQNRRQDRRTTMAGHVSGLRRVQGTRDAVLP